MEIESTTIATFLDKFCETAQKDSVSKRDFYERYRKFSAESGTIPLAINTFCTTLKSEFGLEEGRIKNERFWKGLRLRPMEEATSTQPVEVVAKIEICEDSASQSVETKAPSNSIEKIESAVNELNLRDLLGTWEIQRF